MKKKKFELRDITDIKVFMLFILDHIAYPVDHSALIEIVSASTSEISLDYDEAIRGIVATGHVLLDEVDGVKYYTVSELGKMVARELYDTLDKDFLEKSLQVTAKYLSFANGGVRSRSEIKPLPDKRYTVMLIAEKDDGVLMNVSLTVNSAKEAEQIASNFDKRPESVYRGLMLSATGRIEYLN